MGTKAVVGGAGSRRERVETMEVRVEAGTGSMERRCWMPRMREALSEREEGEWTSWVEGDGGKTLM